MTASVCGGCSSRGALACANTVRDQRAFPPTLARCRSGCNPVGPRSEEERGLFHVSPTRQTRRKAGAAKGVR